MISPEKRTALITGATSGIGLAIARRFAREGKKIILCGRRAGVLAEIKAELSQLTEVFDLTFDVRHPEEVQRALASLPGEWQNIDILINNAGNAHGLEPLTEANPADWDAMMDGNVKGLLYVSQPVMRGMKARGQGHIVNISSVAARQTYAGGVVYCASKKAVDAISEGMRLELTEFGIKVTNIQPGAVETGFSEVRFKGDAARAAAVYAGYEALQAGDIADAVSYCVNAPGRVSVAEMTLYPTAQAEPRTIYRKP